MSDQTFDALAAEVITLSNLLRKNSFNLHREDALPPGALHVLQVLKQNGPTTVPRLSRIRLTSRQNIQITVNRLRAAGWVEFSANPRHRRSSLVQLTAMGEAALEGAIRREAGHAQDLNGQISGQELAATTEILRRVRQLVLEQSKQAGTVANSRKRKSKATDQPVPET